MSKVTSDGQTGCGMGLPIKDRLPALDGSLDRIGLPVLLTDDSLDHETTASSIYARHDTARIR